MSDNRNPSDRLVEQRVRNRIMEEIWGLSRGNLRVHEAGPGEYFETFFDWFPYEGEPEWYPAMTPKETSAVREVCKVMQRALSEIDISGNVSVDDVVRTGWPERIAPVAKQALDLMLVRGRFSEEEEEQEPSTPIPWP
jgi:hypothetical protein